MMIRMAIGISHPAGRSRTFSAHGRKCCHVHCQPLLGSIAGFPAGVGWSALTSTTWSCLMVIMTVRTSAMIAMIQQTV